MNSKAKRAEKTPGEPCSEPLFGGPPIPLGGRSLTETGYANQLLLESCRGIRRTPLMSQHGMHRPDVSPGHILIFLAGDDGRTRHHTAPVLPRIGKHRIWV